MSIDHSSHAFRCFLHPWLLQLFSCNPGLVARDRRGWQNGRESHHWWADPQCSAEVPALSLSFLHDFARWSQRMNLPGKNPSGSWMRWSAWRRAKVQNCTENICPQCSMRSMRGAHNGHIPRAILRLSSSRSLDREWEGTVATAISESWPLDWLDQTGSQDIPSFEWAGNATIPFSGARLRRTLFASLNLRKINGRLTLVIFCAVQERIEPQTWDALLAALAALWVSIVESSRLTLPIINLSRLPRWRIERSQRLLTRFSWRLNLKEAWLRIE